MTMPTSIGGPNAGDGNLFKNTNDASTTGFENNVGCVLSNGATQRCHIQGNIFDNVGRGGGVANTSIVRTQNSGGAWVGEVRDKTLQNFNLTAGGRHGIGHVSEPPSGKTGTTSLIIDNNDINGTTD